MDLLLRCSPATVTFLANSLATDPRYADLLNMFDFFLLPVVNPDGYEFSHTTDRLWRKNRAPNSEAGPLITKTKQKIKNFLMNDVIAEWSQVFGLCRGVDLNRNFGYKWAHKLNVFDPRPASPIPCLECEVSQHTAGRGC